MRYPFVWGRRGGKEWEGVVACKWIFRGGFSQSRFGRDLVSGTSSPPSPPPWRYVVDRLEIDI